MIGKDKKDDKKGAAQAAPKKEEKSAKVKMAKLTNDGAQVQMPHLKLTVERGRCEVPEASWSEAKKLPMVKKFLDSGRLREGWGEKKIK